MIRACLFDIGNVLVHFDFSLMLREVAASSAVGDASEALRMVEVLKLPYEDGRLSREDFFKEAFAIFGYRGTPAQFARAWQGIFTPNEPMVALARKLHGQIPLFLLSNTNDLHVEGLFRDFDFFSLFSGATFSYAARVSKPHPAIFEQAICAHGLDPRSTFFVDDLAANINAARTLQFHTHHYHHERHDALVTALHALGLRV